LISGTNVAQVAPDVYRCALPTGFSVGDVHVYLVPDQNGVMVIDTGLGTEESMSALERGLADIGSALGQVHTIVLTHGHADHAGGAALLQERTNARLIGHPLLPGWLQPTPESLQAEAEFFERLYTECGLAKSLRESAHAERNLHRQMVRPVRLDATVAEHDAVAGWRVVYTPGHSESHISLWREQDRVLIGGDVCIQHVSVNALVEPNAEYRDRVQSVAHFRATFLKLLALGITEILPGHGQSVTDPDALLARRLEEQETRIAQLMTAIYTGERTVWELAAALFPRHLKELTLIVSEVLGHLDYALVAGQVSGRRDADGAVRYRLAP